jgi:hypothetical protein
MTKEEIVSKVKSLNLPKGSYIVFGSCPMAIAGIREAGDIDFLVSTELFEQLERSGWKQIEKTPNDKSLVKDDFEAHINWDFSSYKPTLEHLLESGDIVDGVPFASLSEVLNWKIAFGRPKDLKDIKLINQYQEKKSSRPIR